MAYETLHINKICRTCLSGEENMRSVFSILPAEGETMRLIEMLMSIASVQVMENDGLPSQVCLQCVQHITSAFSFKQLCEESENTLRDHLELKPLLTGDVPASNTDTDIISVVPSVTETLNSVAVTNDGCVLPTVPNNFEIKKELEDLDIKYDNFETSELVDVKPNIEVKKETEEYRKEYSEDETEQPIYPCEECTFCFTTQTDLQMHSRGKKLLALALNNSNKSSQKADNMDALEVALENDLLFLESDIPEDFAKVVKEHNKIVDIDENHREKNDGENAAPRIGRKAKRKLSKDLGQEYVSSSGKIVEKKALRDNPCKERSCSNQCNSFTEDDRKEIFKFYWDLADSNKQKSFLSECMTICPVKRRRKSKGIRTKKSTNEYYFQRNNERIRVCRQFFVNTLDITIRLLRTVADNKNLTEFPEFDLRGRHLGPNKTTEEQLARFRAFIDSLPAIPSHYCRGSSTKKYLPSDIGSFNNVYRLYLRQMEKDSFTALKRSKFLALLKINYNIGIHVPKKDKCSRFKNLPDKYRNEAEIKSYENHIAEKDASKKYF